MGQPHGFLQLGLAAEKYSCESGPMKYYALCRLWWYPKFAVIAINLVNAIYRWTLKQLRDLLNSQFTERGLYFVVWPNLTALCESSASLVLRICSSQNV